MTKKREPARKLEVKKTTLRTLDRKALDKVAGGARQIGDYDTSRGRGTVGVSA